MTLIFLAALLVVTGLYAGYRGVRGDRLLPGTKQAELKTEVPSHPASLTLESLFNTDFMSRNVVRNGQLANMYGKDPQYGVQVLQSQIPVAYILDFNSGSHFVAFYIPKDQDDYATSVWIASNYRRLIKEWLAGLTISGKLAGDSKPPGATKFSGRVYIYHEDPLSPQQIAKLTTRFERDKSDVTFRSLDYVMARYAEPALLAQAQAEAARAAVAAKPAEYDGQSYKKVVVDCQPTALPSVMPTSGVIHSLIVPPKPLISGSQGMGVAFEPPGSPIHWPDGIVGPYVCMLKNLSKEPIVALTIDLELVVAPPKHSTFVGAGRFAGEGVRVGSTQIAIERIDAGQTFQFYVMNYSNKSAQFVFPGTGRSKSLEKSNALAFVDLISAQPIPMTFLPSNVYPDKQ